MWIKRQEYCLYFNINELKGIKIYTNIFNMHSIQIKLNNRKITFCKSKHYEVIYNIFELIIDSISKNNAISLDIPYYIKDDLILK